MKLFFLFFTISLSVFANEPAQEWEALDLEESNLREIKEKQKQEYEDREGDLQIQAEEEIIPVESEDSRNLHFGNEEEEED